MGYDSIGMGQTSQSLRSYPTTAMDNAPVAPESAASQELLSFRGCLFIAPDFCISLIFFSIRHGSQ